MSYIDMVARRELTWDANGNFTATYPINYIFDGVDAPDDDAVYMRRSYTNAYLASMEGHSITLSLSRVEPSPSWLMSWNIFVEEYEQSGDIRVTYSNTVSPSWSNQPNHPTATHIGFSSTFGHPGDEPDFSAWVFYLHGASFVYNGQAVTYNLIPGRYRMSDGIFPDRDVEIWSVDIDNLRVEESMLNIESPSNIVKVRGEILVDASSTWTPPSAPATWRMLFKMNGEEVHHYDGLSSISSPDTNGVAGYISADITLDSFPVQLEGNVTVELIMLVNMTGGGQRQVLADPVPFTVTRCRCETENALGNNRTNVRISIHSSPVGPSLTESLTNSTCSYLNAPASLGYGWSSIESAKVLEPVEGEDLFYQDENGRFYSWINNNGLYTPRFADNRMSIDKNSGSTTQRYTVTYRNGSKRHFGSDSKITEEVDANGNSTTYQHTTNYFSVSDGKGRTVYYHRTSANPQPYEISDSSTPGDTNAKRYQLTYWGSADPAPDRLKRLIAPEGQETQYYYDTDGRLIEERHVRPTLGDRTIAYEYYDTSSPYSGRLKSKTVFGLYRESMEYEVDIDGHVGTRMTYEDLTPGNTNEIRESYQVLDSLGRTIRTYQKYGEDSNQEPLYNVTVIDYNDPSAPQPSPLPSDPNEIQESDDPYLPVLVTAPNGAMTQYFYTPRGNVKKVIDAAGNGTVYKYAEQDSMSNIHSTFPDYVLEVQRSPVTVNGSTVTYQNTKFSYHATTGNLLSVKDADGNTSSFTYNGLGQVTETVDRRGFRTRFEYDSVTARLKKIGVQKSEDPMDNNLVTDYRYVEFDYDDYDNVDYVKAPLVPAMTSTFDHLDRVTQIIDPRGVVTNYQYLDRVLQHTELLFDNGISTESRKVTPGYDSAGRMTSVVRDKSSSTSETRVSSILDGFSQTLELIRTKLGNPESFKSKYDILGRVVESEDPLGKKSTIAYEPYCNTNATTSARGVRVRSDYDLLCRPSLIQSGKVGTNDLEVSNAREIRTPHYDELSRMVKMEQKRVPVYGVSCYADQKYGGTTEERLYEYDSLDRLTKLVFEDLKEMTFEYDEEGNLVTMTEDASSTTPLVTTYSYYGDGLLHQVTFERTSGDMTFTYIYDDAGRLAEIDYPSGTGIKALFDDGASPANPGWDNNGQLTHLRYEQNSAELRRFEYTYDDAGNRVTHKDIPATGNAKLWVYGYDWFNRLTSVSLDENANPSLLSTSSATVQRAYAFDESDNRISLTINDPNPAAVETLTYEFDKADNLLNIKQQIGSGSISTIETFGADDDGNMTERTKSGVTTTYAWDDFNRLIVVAASDASKDQKHVFGTNGFRRKKKDKNDVETVEYAPALETSVEKRSSDTVTYLLGHQLLGFETSGSTYFLLTDGLASVREVVGYNSGSSQWEVQASYEFSEYGERISTVENGVSSSRTYVGGLSVKDEVSDIGLMLAGHRFFDPQLGRFLSRDPIGHAGGLNLYNYGDSSPVDNTDHTGLSPDSFTVEIPEFDLGCDFSDCIANCFEQVNVAGDFGIGALTVAGAPFPKSIAKYVFKVRVSGFGGITPYTGLPSIASQKLGMGRGNWLRRSGKVASRAWIAYGLYLAGAEIGCLAICQQAHP